MWYLLQHIHFKLERYLSRKVGKWAVEERKTGKPFPSSIWFKAASRIEFRLRYIVYPDKWDEWTYQIKRLPKYPGGE